MTRRVASYMARGVSSVAWWVARMARVAAMVRQCVSRRVTQGVAGGMRMTGHVVRRRVTGRVRSRRRVAGGVAGREMAVGMARQMPER